MYSHSDLDHSDSSRITFSYDSEDPSLEGHDDEWQIIDNIDALSNYV